MIKEQEFLEISEIVEEILEKQVIAMLEREQTIESRSRLENLDEFMSVPKDYEENTPLEEQSLINFLTDLSLVADIDEAQIDDGVTMMTMHSAKGLEFPIVFLMEWKNHYSLILERLKAMMIMTCKKNDEFVMWL